MMSRNYIIIIGVNILLIILISIQPQSEMDWSRSYWHQDKIPYGTYILDQILENRDQIIEISEPISEYVIHDTLHQAHSIIFLNEKLNDLNYFDRITLDSLVKMGHQVVFNGQFIPFHDSLGIEYVSVLDTIFENDFTLIDELIDEENFIATLSIDDSKVEIPINVYGSLIIPKDGCDCEVIADINIKDQSFPGIIKINHGKGSYISNPYPIIFTNYGITENKASMFSFLQKYLSHIDHPQHVMWDRHYVNGKRDIASKSLLRVLFRKKGLKFAYYFTLIGVGIFFIFEGRRKQQKIPVVKDPKNSTIEYARSISRLHMKYSKNEMIFEKMINNWASTIYDQTSINILEADKKEIELIAIKINKEEEKLQEILTEIHRINLLNGINVHTLISLYKKIR